MILPARASESARPQALRPGRIVEVTSHPSIRAKLSPWAAGLLAVLLCMASAGCGKAHETTNQALYKSGMWSETIQKLQDMDVSESEATDLITVHIAGLSDNGCVTIIKTLRSRKQMLTDGTSIADLLRAGVSEPTVLELLDLDQIGPWIGEAEGIRLAGYSDQVVLAIARRRAKHLPTVSSASLVQLKNTGVDERQALSLIERGLTDEQAGQMIAAHQAMEMPRGFVRGGKKRH